MTSHDGSGGEEENAEDVHALNPTTEDTFDPYGYILKEFPDDPPEGKDLHPLYSTYSDIFYKELPEYNNVFSEAEGMRFMHKFMGLLDHTYFKRM